MKTNPLPEKTVNKNYERAFLYISSMLESKKDLSFKKAVFVTENAYLDEAISEEKYDQAIDGLKTLCNHLKKMYRIENYREKDSLNFFLNGITYNLISDTLRIYSPDKEYYHLPYTYDFYDFFGKTYWDKTFVINLLTDNSGTCRSLPYLYKIIADEIGAKCWLSLAPQHIYIKNYSKQFGWYNTELTSKEFPTEGWVMASGYITLEAVQNGIFMDTIGTKQAVALCLVDLANGYNRKLKNNDGNFVIKCCDLSLKYFPTNINAMLLKAETLKDIYLKNKENDLGKKTYQEMLDLYLKIHKLGYREMPEAMYMEWMKSLQTQKDKFVDKKISDTFKNNKK
ncbi:MAG: hypothetical protein KJZ56_11325 [Flavobacteriales bacterium]|nr:hypothetical protein [Flavobacteriales bacterium]